MTYTHVSHRGLGCERDSVCGITCLCLYGPALTAEEVALIQQSFETTQCPWLVLTALHAAHGVDHVASRAKWTATHFGFVAKAIAGNLGLFYFSAHA